MKVKPHARYKDFLAVVASKSTTAIPFAGEVYRTSSPRWSKTADVTSGAGALIAGGRWNAPDTFRAVYTALSMETALAELVSTARHYGLPDSSVLPRVWEAIEVKGLTRVLDVTSAAIRRRLKVRLADLTTEDWRALNNAGGESLCQAIGRAAHSAGFQGLLVPSARLKKGVNLVVFPGPKTPALTVVKGDEIDAALK
ncbi:MAG TPA: RES family NAD+ phosphorylase [Planctomycetota bacterium]|nr:RES family NAD+ phosphorylase [Planctomycetota bacterium]